MRKLASTGESQRAIERHERRGDRFGFLRERLSGVDVEGIWAELERELTLGDRARSAERLEVALDAVDGNSRKAGMLHQTATEELEEFNVHFRAAFSEWEAHARAHLELRKREKRHSGAITVELVENWVARNVAAYGRWKRARLALERTKALTKQMVEAWQSRAASLRKMADLAMSRRGVDPNMLDRRRRRGGDEE